MKGLLTSGGSDIDIERAVQASFESEKVHKTNAEVLYKIELII